MSKKRTCIISPIYEPKKNAPPEKSLPSLPPKKPLIKLIPEIDIKNFLQKAKLFLCEKASALWKKACSFRPLIKKTSLAVVAALILIVMFCTFFRLGFDAYINDRFIGTVRGYEEADAILEEISDGKAVEAAAKPPGMYMRIVPNDGFTSESAVRDKARLADGSACFAVMLCWEGKDICAIKSYRDALDAIEKYASFYGGTVVGFDGDMSLKYCVSDLTKMSDCKGAAELMKNSGVRIITEEVREEKIKKEKPVNIVEDKTKRSDYRKVKTPGNDGESVQTLQITRINSEETGKKVISEKVTISAEPETIIVGTRPIPTGKGSGSFIRPAAGAVSSNFGERWGRQHFGIDIAGNIGDNIYASDEGVVIFSGTQEGYGNVIILDHCNGFTTRYAHCNKLYMKKGDIAAKGDIIAAVGSTGNSTGPHLHFEVRKNDTPINPLSIMNIK